MALVFQYGSNMSSKRINSDSRLKGDASVIGVANAKKDFELVFDIDSKSNKCAAADITHVSGRRIWGVLYEIADRLICRDTSGARKSLDEIEGEGSNYQERIKRQSFV